MMEFFDASPNTIDISFNTWSGESRGEEMPSGYIVQRRKNGTMMRIDASEVDHNVNVTHYSVIIKDLEPDTLYYIRVVPFIEDAGGSYHGIPTDESGPYSTLRLGK